MAGYALLGINFLLFLPGQGIATSCFSGQQFRGQWFQQAGNLARSLENGVTVSKAAVITAAP
ncbi:hypothetical protein [Kribbella sp.]|uniref:hypothetical protein n=1 Tax=Kribbella sp. TaxID=1871183 RepID=UPI002D79760F|nr:hypothetical protein [Kribbella sp.]